MIAETNAILHEHGFCVSSRQHESEDDEMNLDKEWDDLHASLMRGRYTSMRKNYQRQLPDSIQRLLIRTHQNLCYSHPSNLIRYHHHYLRHPHRLAMVYKARTVQCRQNLYHSHPSNLRYHHHYLRHPHRLAMVRQFIAARTFTTAITATFVITAITIIT